MNIIHQDILSAFYVATEDLCKKFYEKYYCEEGEDNVHHRDDFYMIGDMKSQGIDVIGIGDQYWELTDIQTALINDMDSKIVWAWYDEYIDQYDHERKMEEGYKQWVNLWHFWLRAIGKPMYTQEEIDRSEAAVKKANDLFLKAIKPNEKL